jgi:hypothetical protein
LYWHDIGTHDPSKLEVGWAFADNPGQLRASQIDHLRRKPTTRCNPLPNILMVNIEEHLRPGFRIHRHARLIWSPRRMETKASAGTHYAHLLARNNSKKQCARRQARALDDKSFAPIAQDDESVDIWPDLATIVSIDHDRRTCDRGDQKAQKS